MFSLLVQKDEQEGRRLSHRVLKRRIRKPTLFPAATHPGTRVPLGRRELKHWVLKALVLQDLLQVAPGLWILQRQWPVEGSHSPTRPPRSNDGSRESNLESATAAWREALGALHTVRLSANGQQKQKQQQHHFNVPPLRCMPP